ncbi:ABC transporter permease [Bacillus alkalicellulosilyticus]|uniref:ABC transporter permease n=1 Tax=Alkalihalobacterium alkalicellulosilyticum TaxID=1912214 RepID=UPI000998184A|nr:ABC transporter permease subunit [Bacillus alkalicellulosilyticus]
MLLKTYVKEIKDCFRDRRTLLLTVFLPIVMMTALTLFYESLAAGGEGDTFTLAVPSSITAEEEAIFLNYQNIEIVKANDPEALLLEGEAHAAILFSDQFIEQVNEGGKAAITLIGDSFSQKSSNLMSIVTNALSTFEKQTIMERLQAQGTDPELIQPFVITQKELSEENPMINLLAMLIPLILTLAIGVGAGPAAADLFAGEKEKKTMEALLMTPVKRSTLLLSKWLTISTVGTITGIITLLVVALEITFLTEHLKQAITIDENFIYILAIALLVIIVYSMFVASLLMLTSIIGKTVKEAQSYSTPIMMLIVFPTMIVTGIGVNELGFHHFAIPMLNIFSLIKELLFGIINTNHILTVIGSNVIVMILVFIIGRILFMKDKWVMN